MTEFRDLDIEILKDKVSFRIEDQDYAGPHGLSPERIRMLERLREESNPTEYGRELFNALFCGGNLEDGYRAARQEEKRARARWRLRLNIDPEATELHCLWWEALYDPVPPPRHLGRWTNMPLSRYLGMETNAPAHASRLNVLAVISNPQDLGTGYWERYPPLDEDAERAVIENALAELGDRVHVEFQSDPASFGKIRERLKNDRFHVLHIVGHGAFAEDGSEACLLLEHPDETTRAVGEQKLGELVQDLPCLQLVVLCACQGAERSGADAFVGLAPKVVLNGIPAVVAMQAPIGVQTAQAFTRRFYAALGSTDRTGGMVDAAMNWARDLLHADFEEEEGWDWAIPVLFMRGDGRLFELEGSGDGSDDGAAAAAPINRRVEHLSAVPQQAGLTPTRAERNRQVPVVRNADEITRLYETMAMQLTGDELTIICRLLWSIPFHELPGESQDEKLLAIVERCRDEGLVDSLWERIQYQLKLREKRALEQAAIDAAAAAKVIDLTRFRETGLAS